MDQVVVNKVLAEIPPSFIRALNDKKRPTSLNLGLGEPSINPDADLVEEGLRKFRNGPQGYTRNAGLQPLREAITAFRPELKAHPDRVLITQGSQEAVFISLAALVNPGDDVLVMDPAFNIYGPITKLFGGRPVSVPMDPADGFALRADAVRKALTPATKVVCVVSPGNPTGRSLSEKDARGLAALAEEHGFTLLVDEVYRELHHTDAPAPTPGAYSNRVITIGSMSKNCAMTGLRVGWTILPQDTYATAIKAHQLCATCAASLCQYIALAAFEKNALFRHREIYRKRLDVTLAAASEHLRRAPVRPEGAFYVMLNFRHLPIPSVKLSEMLLEEEDVVMVPGEAFGPSAHGFFRISFAQDDATVVEGIQRLGNLLRRHGWL